MHPAICVSLSIAALLLGGCTFQGDNSSSVNTNTATKLLKLTVRTTAYNGEPYPYALVKVYLQRTPSLRRLDDRLVGSNEVSPEGTIVFFLPPGRYDIHARSTEGESNTVKDAYPAPGNTSIKLKKDTEITVELPPPPFLY